MSEPIKKGPATLRLAIVGGGRACRSFLQFIEQNPFSFLDVQVTGVCDIDPQADGIRLARRLGIPTTSSHAELLKTGTVDCILELTRSRQVLLELVKNKPKGVGIIDHNLGKLSWSLFNLERRLRKAEEQAREERNAFDFLLKETNDRVVALRPDFTIVKANDAYLKAVQRSRREVIGNLCYRITHGLEAPCSTAQVGAECPLLETLRTGESAHKIHECLSPEKKEGYCDLVTYPVKDANGRIIRVIEIWRDITDELYSQWEKRARGLRDDLQRMVEEDRLVSLGKLVASSVHEINNPIQGLLTLSHLAAEMLSRQTPSAAELATLREYMELMSSELERCGKIVSGLLSFARQKGSDYRNLDINEVLEATLSLVRHRMEMQQISLETRLCLEPLYLYGDLNQLQQCVLSILLNAIEAMPEGGFLKVSSRKASGGKVVQVAIKDTGEGIPPEHIHHIFDPFFTTKKEGQGTGLGLSVAYGVVKRHKGQIDVQSKPGCGSTFSLSFPAAADTELSARQ